jgi:hypothetical protein
MKRRQWLRALAAALAVAGLGVQAQPQHTVSNAQLQEAVAARFPLTRPVGGLLALTVQAPTLRLLPEHNRLGAQMVVQAAGPALPGGTTGHFDVDFALRYESSDQTLRAHQLKVNSLSLSGLPPGPAALLQAYGPALAEQTLLEVVLHKLTPQDLMLADDLGMEPGAITVTAKGLVIAFVPKKTL